MVFVATTALFLFCGKLTDLDFLESFFFFDKIIGFVFPALPLLFERVIGLNFDFLEVIFFDLILRFIGLPPSFFLDDEDNELFELSRGDNNI